MKYLYNLFTFNCVYKYLYKYIYNTIYIYMNICNTHVVISPLPNHRIQHYPAGSMITIWGPAIGQLRFKYRYQNLQNPYGNQ